MTPHLRAAALFAALALVATASAQPPLPPPRPVPDKPEAKQDEPNEPEPGIKVAEKGQSTRRSLSRARMSAARA